MSKQEQVLNEAIDFIYLLLFDMCRAQMIIECKQHEPDGWIDLYEDEDEYIRDHLSIAALNCLSGAVKAVATYLVTHEITDTVAATGGLWFTIKPHKVDGLVIWEDES